MKGGSGPQWSLGHRLPTTHTHTQTRLVFFSVHRPHPFTYKPGPKVAQLTSLRHAVPPQVLGVNVRGFSVKLAFTTRSVPTMAFQNLPPLPLPIPYSHCPTLACKLVSSPPSPSQEHWGMHSRGLDHSWCSVNVG